MASTVSTTTQQEKYARIPTWLRELEFIRAFFTWFFMLLARLAEPLLMLSVIYVIVEQAVKPLHSDAIEYLAIAIMVSAPEVMIAGSFKIAAVAKQQGQKLATLLYITCWLFILLLLITVADVLIFHLSGIALELLMFFRCAVSVGYSIIMRVMPHDDSEKLSESASELTSKLTEKFSSELTGQVERITAAAENKLTELTQKFSGELTGLVSQAQADRLSLATISETTEAHSTTLAQLAALPGLVERQSHTLKQAMQDLRSSIESSAASKPKLSLVAPSVNTEKLTSDEGELTNRQFIEDHLSKHPEARNVDVIEAGSKHGLTVSQSQVSQVRRALKELSA